MVSLSPERPSDIIGSIYDCVVAPEKWPSTLAAIMNEFGYAMTAISVHDANNGDVKLHITVGADQDWLDAVPHYGADVLQLWGGPQKIPDFPLEEPIIQSQVTPRSQWHNNAYFRDILEPRQLHDCVMIGLVRDANTAGAVAFGRHADQGEVGEDDLNVLRLLAPHIRRAVTIGRLLEQQAAATATFSEILEKVSAGILLVDEDCTIVHANAAGRRMLDTGDAVQLRNGRLSTTSPLTSAVLIDAVRQAANLEIDIERRSIDIPARLADGSPTVMQVLPLSRRTVRNGIEQRTAAAIFIANSAAPPRLADVMGLLYRLTPAETRIFELIVEGKAPAEISKVLGVSVSTVKTHLGRVFDKTGCSRQADLVAMAAKVTLVI
ncbi:helix-turn-helix transcriptional regulator [Hyphomicrobium sp. LHD-15]|uniref:helix-turn-helix transcriptional regulator n=1 Tax=Hyphomicrobium sp. LHD-15 TaxID=3072142 RepID=UPI00280F3C3A|nr:helix-turn-helix transcriptional regulator [Hyphomicrobium sp. LHD-15]MDQ8700625.1 helix-turn-helix transcriptional regulator [Hyphomicrobium sp. LHD-15]